MYTEPLHIRADAKLVAKILSCGSISTEKADELLKVTAALAGDAAVKGRSRDFAALMRVLIQAAKLGIERGPSVAIQNNIGIGTDGRAIDSKRRIEVESAEFDLAKKKGEYVRRDEVEMVFSMMGSHLAQALEDIAKVSPRAREILSTRLEMAENAINAQVSTWSQ